MSSPDANTEVALLKEAEEWKQCKGPARLLFKPNVKIVIVGIAGVGKSALANSLISSNLFLEGGSYTVPCTTTSKRVAFGVGGDEVVIWDTPGFTARGSEDRKSLNDIKLKVFWPIGKREADVLLYAIDMNKSRFEENDMNITVMKMLTETFNQVFWKNAVIVLMNANICIDAIKDSSDSSDYVKKRYIERRQEWERNIRQYLESSVLPKDLVQNIQIIQAGYTSQSHLETEPRGTSWVHDMWFSILHAAKTAAKPVVLRVLLHKIFEENLISGEKLVRFIASHQYVYQQKILDSGTHCIHERKRIIGFVCSFLNLQEVMLKNVHTLQRVIALNESHGDHNLLSYWKKVSSSVDIMVVGGLGSGKTSLINSLYFGREALAEGKTIYPSTAKAYFKEFRHEKVTCRVWDTPGLQSYLEDIRLNYYSDKLGLFLFCIGIVENRKEVIRNLKNVTSILGKEVWQHAVIVLTFANVSITDQDYTSMVESWTDFIEKQLRDVTDPDNESNRKFKIVPAGYHEDKFISGDPKREYWAINLWMEMVSEAKTWYQPALVQLLLNYFSNSFISRFDKSMAAAFIHRLIELLHTILKNLNLIV